MATRRWAAILSVTTLAVTAVAVSSPTAATGAPPVRFSTAQLASTKLALDRRLVRPPDGVTSWYVDPTSKQVTVSVLAGDATALASAQRSVAGLAGARIESVTKRPRLYTDLVGGQAINTSGGRCSLGFSARDSTTNYVLTAGHCTNGKTTWKGYNQVLIGTTAKSDFPIDDFGSIAVNSTAWTPTAKVQTSGTTTVVITGSNEAAIGASICRSGSTTGYHCGVIQAKNVTVNYGGGNMVYGLTKTNVCAEGGDSGGSWISGTQAQGVTSGGFGNCTSGGTTYFQPVNEILTRYKLSLITKTNAPAPPPGPSVLLCSDVNYAGICTGTNVDVPNMSALAVGNDTLSSIQVPSGRWLTLYQDSNYAGPCSSFDTNQATLSDTTVGNDSASSFKITTTKPTGC